MKKCFNKKVGIVFLMFLIVFSVSGCSKGGSREARQAYVPTKLIVWGVWEDEDDLRPLFNAYKSKQPNVSFEYRKFRYEEYERELLEALAEDRGPDIFMVHNTWLPRYQSKLLPALPSITVPRKYVTGSIKKEEVTEIITKPGISTLDVKRSFLDVVVDDVIMDYQVDAGGKAQNGTVVYGLPFSMDTLAMYYNKDLLSNAGIVEPATNWNDFQEQVKKITRIDPKTGDILIAGTAMGTSNNVPRSFDILSLLMMQNMTQMVDENNRASFDKVPRSLPSGSGSPALGALNFYVQFASSLYTGYSWNSQMPDALQSFADGRVAYFFGYNYHRDFINGLNPGLNYSVAPMPQVGENQKMNYASYWVMGVSQKAKNKNYSWDFLSLAMDEDVVSKYLSESNNVTALKAKTIINQHLQNEDLVVFAEQLLTAQSWFRGLDPAGAEQAFHEMIDEVLAGEIDPQKSLKNTVLKINTTLRNK